MKTIMSGLNSSQLIESARIEKLRWFGHRHLLYIIVSVIGVVILSQILALIFTGLLAFFVGLDRTMNLALETSLAKPWELTLFLIVSFLPFFLAVWLWVLFFEGRAFLSNGLRAVHPLLAYGRGLLVGLGLILAVIGIMALLGDVGVEQPLNGAAVGAALLVAIGWAVQGAAEEFLTRGFIIQIVGRRFGVVSATIVSSTIFAVAHGANPNVTWLAVVNLTLYAILMAVYALWEGNLWGVFAIHSVWNWAQGNLFGFEVSGNQLGNGIVLDLAERGPDWITGGPFGLEGGVITSTVLFLTLMALLVRVGTNTDGSR